MISCLACVLSKYWWTVYSHTIFVAHTFTNCDTSLLVGILQDHDLGQFNTQTNSHRLVSRLHGDGDRGSGAAERTGQPRARPARGGCYPSTA